MDVISFNGHEGQGSLDSLRPMFQRFKASRDVAPKDWDARMAFWRNVLVDGLSEANISVTTLQQLEKWCTRSSFGDGVPRSPDLTPVVREMSSGRGLFFVSKEWFLSAESSGSYLWYRFLIPATRWIFQLSEFPSSPTDVLVVPSVVRKNAGALYSLARDMESECPDGNFVFSELWKQLSLPAMESMELEEHRKDVIVGLLETQGRLKRFVVDGVDCVKVTFTGGKVVVTDADHGIVKLRVTERKLRSLQARLAERIESEMVNVKRCLSQGTVGRRRAMEFLRHAKRIQKHEGGVLQQVEKISEVLRSIASMKLDAHVVEALNAGSSVLKSLERVVDLEMVDEAMERLNEHLGNQEEISSAFSTLSLEDSDELERELADLEKSVRVTEPSPPVRLVESFTTEPDAPEVEPAAAFEKVAKKRSDKEKVLA